MRLLHTETGQLHTFSFPPPVPYAILSHTWSSPAEDDWLRYSQISSPSDTYELGRFGIISKFCQLARDQHFQYVWADAACIDKNSSADVSETINSLPGYLQGADVCFAFLADLSGEPSAPARETWSRCQFWNRAWTLQELVLPTKVQFYDARWNLRGERAAHPLASLISSLTGVDEDVLARERSLCNTSVARRMAWAAHRRGTRPEDAAYSLMGLFNVSMPVVYGEGEYRAFRRLQEEILKQTNDMSLLAWTSPDGDGHRGIFANSPMDFVCFGESAASTLPCIFNGFAALTSKGVLVEGQFAERGCGLFLDLGVQTPDRRNNDPRGIVLRRRHDGTYERATPNELDTLVATDRTTTMRIMVSREHPDTIEHTNPDARPGKKSRNLPTLRKSLPVFLGRPTMPVPFPQSSNRSETDSTLSAPDFQTPVPGDADWIRIDTESPRDEEAMDDADDACLCSSMQTSQQTELEQGWDSAQSVTSDATTILSPREIILEESWHNCDRSGYEAEEIRPRPAEMQPLETLPSTDTDNLKAQLSRILLDQFCASQVLDTHVTEKRVRRGKRSKDRVLRRPPRSQKRRTHKSSELSCPFYAKDPERYVCCLVNHELGCMEDVEDHLWAHHRRPYHCPTCKGVFASAAVRDRHIRLRACDFRSASRFEGISEDERDVISRVRRTGSQASQWFRAWDVLFPDLATKRPGSPHLRGALGTKVSRLRVFWREHGRMALVERLAEISAEDAAVEVAANTESLFSDVLTLSIGALARDHQTPDTNYV